MSIESKSENVIFPYTDADFPVLVAYDFE
jgi:hypothetical protein